MLEQEKEQILDMLNSVSVNTELLRLGQGDREDITAITNRLAARQKTVDVSSVNHSRLARFLKLAAIPTNHDGRLIELKAQS
ncbi:hypothetical protein OSTOST_04664 [Ostertagia ostertagi]